MKKNLIDDININDILYRSWGYDQTNIDFYKVIKKTTHYIFYRKLKSTQFESNKMGMTGKVIPSNNFSNDEIKRGRIKEFYGTIHVGKDFLSKWSGKPLENSWYG